MINEYKNEPKVVASRSDVWNPMVKLMNEHPDESVKHKAKILLLQYNTAGGRRIKDELEFMLQYYGY